MKKDFFENLIHGFFLIAGLITIAAVLVISIYLIISGLPAISQIGLKNFLFGKTWNPTGANPQYGILPFILTSVYGTCGAILFGTPLAFFTAVFLSKVASQKYKNIFLSGINLLAGIPSVVYGLVGMLVLVSIRMWIIVETR